jgi:hypothetical protein
MNKYIMKLRAAVLGMFLMACGQPEINIQAIDPNIAEAITRAYTSFGQREQYWIYSANDRVQLLEIPEASGDIAVRNGLPLHGYELLLRDPRNQVRLTKITYNNVVSPGENNGHLSYTIQENQNCMRRLNAVDWIQAPTDLEWARERNLLGTSSWITRQFVQYLVVEIDFMRCAPMPQNNNGVVAVEIRIKDHQTGIEYPVRFEKHYLMR